MTTSCSSCGRNLNEEKADGRFVACPCCSIFTPIGANSYKEREGGIDKMGNPKVKKEKKEKKGTLVQKCSKCGKLKAVRPDIYDKRVEKFGSVEKLNAKYLCRECRPKTVKEDKK